MDERYLGKYLDKTKRLQEFDYSSRNDYFITLCVKNKAESFGEIIDGEMHLSELGQVAHSEWLRTFEIRKTMNLIKGEFVVMPDHFHAMISIRRNEHNKEYANNRFGIQSQNLGSIIRGFKAAVTTYARKNGIDFTWQQNYFDRIIRDPRQFEATENYIRNNPKNRKKK